MRRTMLSVPGIGLMVLPAAAILLTTFTAVLAPIFASILTAVFAPILAPPRLVGLARDRGSGKQGAGDEQGSTQLYES